MTAILSKGKEEILLSGLGGNPIIWKDENRENFKDVESEVSIAAPYIDDIGVKGPKTTYEEYMSDVHDISFLDFLFFALIL